MLCVINKERVATNRERETRREKARKVCQVNAMKQKRYRENMKAQGYRVVQAREKPSPAKSSYELYTFIETAKANDWNPGKYLTRIFQKAAAMKPADDWGQLLPWNLTP
jgi:predicted secreted protein